jgi:hypothetical protein
VPTPSRGPWAPDGACELQSNATSPLGHVAVAAGRIETSPDDLPMHARTTRDETPAGLCAPVESASEGAANTTPQTDAMTVPRTMSRHNEERLFSTLFINCLLAVLGPACRSRIDGKYHDKDSTRFGEFA